MKIITCASIKGGAGKTALSVFLSQSLLSSGRRVLAVDVDHNNNLTDYFLRSASPDALEKANVYHLLAGRAEASTCVHKTESGIDVMPATITLGRIGSEMSRDPGALLRFGSSLKRLRYDVVVIDTPPSLSFELTAALYAADVVLSPVTFSRWTVQGFLMLKEEIENVRRTLGKAPALFAVPAVVTSMQEEKLRASLNGYLSQTAVHRASAVKTACDTGRPLKENSKSFKEFTDLAREILK